MRETSEDVARLQARLDASVERAGDFLRASFEMPEKGLSAAQVARHLHGSRTVALATVTAGGEPRVAPISALFYRGTFHIPTVATAARPRHILRRPAVSLTYFEGNALAILVHGRSAVIAPGDADFDVLGEMQREAGNGSVLTWGAGVYLRVEPDVMYTHAEDRHTYPE